MHLDSLYVVIQIHEWQTKRTLVALSFSRERNPFYFFAYIHFIWFRFIIFGLSLIETPSIFVSHVTEQKQHAYVATYQVQTFNMTSSTMGIFCINFPFRVESLCKAENLLNKFIRYENFVNRTETENIIIFFRYVSDRWNQNLCLF